MLISKEKAKEILEYVSANPNQTTYSTQQIKESIKILANKLV